MQQIKSKDLDTIFEFSRHQPLALIHLSQHGELLRLNAMGRQQLTLANLPPNNNLGDLCQKRGLMCPILTWMKTKPITQCTPYIGKKGYRVEWQALPILHHDEDAVSWLLSGKVYQNLFTGSALSQFCQMVGKLPCFVYMKSLDKTYCYSNDKLIDSFHFDPLNKPDDDAPWGASAQAFQLNDRLAIKTGKIIKREYSLKEGQPFHTLSIKMPIHSTQGRLEGMLGLSTPYSIGRRDELNKMQDWLQQVADRHINLSPSEMRCLNLAAQGKSAIEIARLLGISKRTVEAHFAQAKLKTGCSKQFQLGYLISSQAEHLAN